jgi:hypothetical protein
MKYESDDKEKVESLLKIFGLQTNSIIVKDKVAEITLKQKIPEQYLTIIAEDMKRITGTTIKFYYNGAQSGATKTMTAITPTGGTANFVLGNFISNGAPYGGYIDEVGIWSKVLSDSEIVSLYNSGAGSQYPYTFTDYFNIFAINNYGNASILTFNSTITNSTINETYITTNGTLKANLTNKLWSNGFYNIKIESPEKSIFRIKNFYYSELLKNNATAYLYENTGSASNCVGNFIVSANCRATIIGGNTFIIPQ